MCQKSSVCLCWICANYQIRCSVHITGQQEAQLGLTLKPRTHDKQMLANMCLSTMLANKSLSCVQKVGQHFLLTNNVCRLRTCSFFVGQQAANGALWLVGCSTVNIMTQNGRIHLTLTTLIILPHFTFALSTTAPEQFSSANVFAYKQLNKSLLQQRRRRLLRPPSPPYCCPTKCCRVWHKCLPTIAGQHLLVVCLRLNTSFSDLLMMYVYCCYFSIEIVKGRV